jgi:arginine/lysine/ornithine decarboxylase
MSLLVQNGSTGGNHVVTYCLAGKKVLVQSNSHVSLHVGLQLAGAKVYYVQPDYDSEYDILLPIKP